MTDFRLSELLKANFGYDRFRPLQREIMESSLAGRDVLAILPTGAGKSLCYQLPAIAREGLTLVVSPLIALMKDQVDQLQASGVPATFLNSTLDATEARARADGLRKGNFKLLYVAPERLMTPDFFPALKSWNVSALAVDEAHCISEWGHDFRPEYRRLREVRDHFPDLPVIALTATATPRVKEDIIRQLGLRDHADFLASFNRPNLSYQISPKSNSAQQAVDFIKNRPGDCGIVYCQSRKRTEELAATLRASGITAISYHAGLDPAERAGNQDKFLRDEVRVVCATVAFGMGINKPDVRFVIHADLPKNLEGYYQETGRAGRDGLPADCLLFYARGDVTKYQRFIDENPDEASRKTARVQLTQMADFAESDTCRRIGLLGYFGESWTAENCGACDNCLSPRETYDATLDTQKLLSCALRIKQHGGFNVGLKHIADVLIGSKGEKILRWGHDQLTTYGIGKDRSAAHWMELGRQLIRRGLMQTDGGSFPTTSVSADGIAALKQRLAIELSRPLAADKPAARQRAGDIPCDAGLFEILRAKRKELADAAQVPPYVVFSDVTLRHFSRDYPQTAAAFLKIPGVGERKLADYGGPFMKAIKVWLSENPRQSFDASEVTASPPPPPRSPAAATGTAMVSLEQWQNGASIEEIAADRGLATGTIETHLAQAIEAGRELDTSRIFTPEEESEMRAALTGYDEPALKPVFEQLGGRISYGKLRIFRALEGRTPMRPLHSQS